MLTPEQILGQITGGCVLDVATGSGGFIPFLLQGLKGYTELVGIDVNERGAAAFAQNFQDALNVRFEHMDAAQMTFSDASFDTVCIANSLHHLPDQARTLAEMLRVLKPGGHLIIQEMYRDGQTDTQMTHVHLHHWWAAVDTAQGILHHETYSRARILEIAAGLGLQDMQVHELSDVDDDPKAPELVQELETIIDRYQQRAEGLPEQAALQLRGEELRRRVQEIGFHSAAALCIVGRKG